MRSRGAAILLFAFACALTPQARGSSEEPVLISGVGAAHGFGMAMDGVQRQARAGWPRDRILDLFYPGTATSTAGGTIRVGLETSEEPIVSVPSGGTISDAPPGAGGWTIALAAGAVVKLRHEAGGVAVVDGVPRPQAAPAPAGHSVHAQQDPQTPIDLPTPPPPEEDPEGPILGPPPTPSGEPSPTPPAQQAPAPASTLAPRLYVWGAGDPALVSVASTGRRYRGTMEIKPLDGRLVVVNHVDLETYVAGIAEEKGQGWPQAGLEALAVAARSLGAATMSWYAKNQANGYDICPTANCQLYLGYDGEAPDMAAATAATAGMIRTSNGRPIMAMYHGNGGGQTESYKRVIDNGTDPHPYLTSVTYPMAAPSRWDERTTLGGIEAALRAAGIAVPGTLERVGVVERGVSPRVLRVRVEASGGTVDVSGVNFATALELRSTWFDLGSRDRSVVRVTNAHAAAPLVGPRVQAGSGPPAGGRPWAGIVVAVGAGAALSAGLRLRRG